MDEIELVAKDTYMVSNVTKKKYPEIDKKSTCKIRVISGTTFKGGISDWDGWGAKTPTSARKRKK